MITRRSLAIIAASVLLSLPNTSRAQQFEWKGIRFGQSEAELARLFPIQCRNTAEPLVADSECELMDSPSACPAEAREACLARATDLQTFGRVTMARLTFRFYSGELVSVSAWFEPFEFNNLVSGIQARYGLPTTRQENRPAMAGTTMDTAHWRRAGSMIVVLRYKGRTNLGSIIVRSARDINEEARRKRAASQRRGNDM